MNKKAFISTPLQLVLAAIVIIFLVYLVATLTNSFFNPTKISVGTEKNFDRLVGTINSLKNNEVKQIPFQISKDYMMVIFEKDVMGVQDYYSKEDSFFESANNLGYNEQRGKLKQIICKNSAGVCLYERDIHNLQKSFNNPLKCSCFKDFTVVNINYRDFNYVYSANESYLYTDFEIRNLELQKVKNELVIKIIN